MSFFNKGISSLSEQAVSKKINRIVHPTNTLLILVKIRHPGLKPKLFFTFNFEFLNQNFPGLLPVSTMFLYSLVINALIFLCPYINADIVEVLRNIFMETCVLTFIL